MDGHAVPVVSYARISADTARDKHGVADQHKVNRDTAARLARRGEAYSASSDVTWHASPFGRLCCQRTRVAFVSRPSHWVDWIVGRVNTAWGTSGGPYPPCRPCGRLLRSPGHVAADRV
jgi:hypothetical protein